MTKVLHLRSSFEPGGTEMLLLELFNYPQPYFMMYLVLLKDGSLIKTLSKNGRNQSFNWFRKRFLDFSVLRKIMQLQKQENIRIIHTHQFIELVYAVCLKIVNPSSKIIHHIHTLYDKKDWAFYAERWLAHTFSSILTVSEEAKKNLVHTFGFNPKKIAVLYNAIKTDNNNSLQTSNNQILPFDKNRFNIIMVANFVWGKDHEVIFKAYDAYIREQLPDVCFYFVGRQTDISERLLQKYITQQDLDDHRIVLCGAIPNAKSLLSNFDMVVMSCFSETFNMALIEAAAVGKPILASDIPVFLELSESGKYFHHFKTGDALDFFQQLQGMIHQFDAISATNDFTHFQNKFGYPAFIQKLHTIYQTSYATEN